MGHACREQWCVPYFEGVFAPAGAGSGTLVGVPNTRRAGLALPTGPVPARVYVDVVAVGSEPAGAEAIEQPRPVSGMTARRADVRRDTHVVRGVDVPGVQRASYRTVVGASAVPADDDGRAELGSQGLEEPMAEVAQLLQLGRRHLGAVVARELQGVEVRRQPHGSAARGLHDLGVGLDAARALDVPGVV